MPSKSEWIRPLAHWKYNEQLSKYLNSPQFDNLYINVRIEYLRHMVIHKVYIQRLIHPHTWYFKHLQKLNWKMLKL